LNALINRPRGSTAEKWRHKYYEDIEIPDDPWGNDFVYHSPPSRYKKKYDSYEVYSLGKDSEEAPGNPNVGY
ncbi:hypothetical protein HOD08_00710, partial [bacterium]|nr:hypothetical protein [bacterium]